MIPSIPSPDLSGLQKVLDSFANLAEIVGYLIIGLIVLVVLIIVLVLVKGHKSRG